MEHARYFTYNYRIQYKDGSSASDINTILTVTKHPIIEANEYEARHIALVDDIAFINVWEDKQS